MLCPVSTVPHSADPNHMISLLLQNYNFATVMSFNINVFRDRSLPRVGTHTQTENHCVLTATRKLRHQGHITTTGHYLRGWMLQKSNNDITWHVFSPVQTEKHAHQVNTIRQGKGHHL